LKLRCIPEVADVPPDEVHVWRIPLEGAGASDLPTARLLSTDERARADRFHAEADGRRYAVGRGALRTILGRYLGLPPERLEFRYGPRGKPALAGEIVSSAPRFNLAHSRDLALLAVTGGREVGVDVEVVRPIPDADRLVARYFSAREGAEYAALSGPEKLGAFFRGWTRKEAYIKATGDGLSMPLNRFDVSLAAGPILLRVAGRLEEASRWALQDLEPGPGFAAAVAVEGSGWTLRNFEFDLDPPFCGREVPA